MTLKFDPITPRATILGRHPFFHFEVRDFLPPAMYEALRSSFPPPTADMRREATGKMMVSPRDAEFKRIIEERPAWREFSKLLETESFLRDSRKLILGALWRARGARGLKGWTFENSSNRLMRKLSRRTQIQLEFSFLGDGASIVPHTDGESKLLSLMLYFPDDAAQESLPLGTQFYRPKSHEIAREWSNFRSDLLSEEEKVDFESSFEMFYQTDFRANVLYGFVKNDLSYHALDPIALPPGTSRKSLNINIVAS